MVFAPKELRNQSLVQKRIQDPKKWTWGKLGEFFEVHRSVAKEIFERDMEKFANEKQIDKYLHQTGENKEKYKNSTQM